MHEHPASVGVYLTDGHIRITLPDGTTGEPHVKAGQAMWHPAGKHLIENLGSTPFELVLTELKTAAGARQVTRGRLRRGDLQRRAQFVHVLAQVLDRDATLFEAARDVAPRAEAAFRTSGSTFARRR